MAMWVIILFSIGPVEEAVGLLCILIADIPNDYYTVSSSEANLFLFKNLVSPDSVFTLVKQFFLAFF